MQGKAGDCAELGGVAVEREDAADGQRGETPELEVGDAEGEVGPAVAAVDEDECARNIPVDRRSGSGVAGPLARRQDKAERPSVSVAAGVEFGREPAAGPAQAPAVVGVLFFSAGSRREPAAATVTARPVRRRRSGASGGWSVKQRSKRA